VKASELARVRPFQKGILYKTKIRHLHISWYKEEVNFICPTIRLWAGIAQWFALGYQLVDSGFKSWQGLGIFLFTTASRPALVPSQPPVQLVPGNPSLGVKRQGCDIDHSPPSSADVKNAWSYTSTSQYAFTVWCSVKARDNFAFAITRFSPTINKERWGMYSRRESA
jgi:hypothetical protein